ncbi:uncharacterized protein LOC129278219 [Lytechinus pictus]|uniref:uncharacterized protein LOC129278219 n=1 Tax=Lytechinus pictus TaxID=7653 RepID=UPI0030B9E7F9
MLVIEANGCPSNWDLLGDQCLLVLASPNTWQKSQEKCAGKGGALFFPETTDSVEFVRVMMTITCSAYWLGCIDRTDTGSFECPNQDGVYWNSQTDFSGHWDWSQYPAPAHRLSGDYCTMVRGSRSWLEHPCTQEDACPVCSRKRLPPTTRAPSTSLAANHGSTTPLDQSAPRSRQRSMAYKAMSWERGCLGSSYVFMISTVSSRIRCAALCLSHPQCTSFNTYRSGNKNCHLSSVGIASVPGDALIYNTLCTYYEWIK